MPTLGAAQLSFVHILGNPRWIAVGLDTEGKPLPFLLYSEVLHKASAELHALPYRYLKDPETLEVSDLPGDLGAVALFPWPTESEAVVLTARGSFFCLEPCAEADLPVLTKNLPDGVALVLASTLADLRNSSRENILQLICGPAYGTVEHTLGLTPHSPQAVVLDCPAGTQTSTTDLLVLTKRLAAPPGAARLVALPSSWSHDQLLGYRLGLARFGVEIILVLRCRVPAPRPPTIH